MWRGPGTASSERSPGCGCLFLPFFWWELVNLSLPSQGLFLLFNVALVAAQCPSSKAKGELLQWFLVVTTGKISRDFEVP